MPEEIRNVGASVRARLQNLSRETGQSFELILTRYALERLLYRLSTSVYADRFVLKGAMLLTSWFTDPHRATRDLDLLGFGAPSPDAMVATFKEILATDVEDGVQFDHDRLARAIAATFERRETEIPAELPDALTPAFAGDAQKQRQWNAFLENVALHPGSLADVIAGVAGFIMPHTIAAAKIGRSR